MTGKALKFKGLKVGGVSYTKHLSETRSINIEPVYDSISDSQSLAAYYDISFEVVVYDKGVKTDPNIYTDTRDLPVRTSIEFEGVQGAETVFIDDIIVNGNIRFEDNRVGYKLFGSKRVTAVDLAPPPDPEDFVIQIDTTLGDGLSRMRLPIQGSNMRIDWGDGTVESVTQTATPGSSNWVTHEYATGGVYKIRVSKQILRIVFNNSGDRLKLVLGKQWGAAVWGSMASAFYGCSNFVGQFIDIPNIDNVTSLSSAFRDCTLFNDDISTWDVSNVNGMRFAFRNATNFNQNISTWDVSNVSDMAGVFFDATSFNQNIGNWDVSSVTDMVSMFNNAITFNQDLSGWCVEQIPSEPANFAIGANAWTLPKPNWGAPCN